ncbi:MAG: cation transporter [Candidatus Marinimicrobia bacterium]|nr:cation transporter [Candidatus Neomarinimicrobiota bacterium]
MNAITQWIVKRLFPDITDFSESSLERDPTIRARVGKFEGWLSAILNVIIFLVKLFIGFSIHSIALLADAVHTLSDSLSSVIIIFSFKVSLKPPDKEHPYGHGRAEYIATLILSMFIVVTGVEFIRSSIGIIHSPIITDSTPLVIVIVLCTVVIKEIMARLSYSFGTIFHSDILIADAWHHRSDAFSSLAPLLSMILANMGLERWDGILGVIVGLFIIWTGYSLSKRAIDSLLGKPPRPELVEHIRLTATSVGGIIGAHHIIIHSYGPNRFISLHLEVDEKESQSDSHAMASQVTGKLTDTFRAHVTVHVDPVTNQGQTAQSIKTVLDTLVESYPDVDSYHDFRLVTEKDHHMILFKLEANRLNSEEKQYKLKNLFTEALSEEFPEFEIQIGFISPILRF